MARLWCDAFRRTGIDAQVELREGGPWETETSLDPGPLPLRAPLSPRALSRLGTRRWVLTRADGSPIDGDSIDFYSAGAGDDPDWVTDNVEYDDPTEIVAELVEVVEVRSKLYGEEKG